MGVMPCERKGCTNVMCDVLVIHQYICNECACEFRTQMDGQELETRIMRNVFTAFMQSQKADPSDSIVVTPDDFLYGNLKQGIEKQ